MADLPLDPPPADGPEAAFPHDLLRQIYNAPETSRRTRRRIRAALPPVVVEYRGCRMRVHPSDNNTEFQIWRLGRTHEERALSDILAQLGERPFLAYDVGANAGSFAVRLGQIAPEGSVVRAFEPNPEMRARLERNLSLNRSDAVVVHDCAISDSEGLVDLCFPDAANLGQARLDPAGEGVRAIKVAARPLMAFVELDAGRRIDFLKVDIEGFEDRAIAPLLDALPPERLPRLVFYEIKHGGNWRIDLTRHMLDHGYTMVRQYGRNALFSAPET